MKASLNDFTAGTMHTFDCAGVKDAVQQMTDRCGLTWDTHGPQEEAALLTKLNVARLDGPEFAVTATAFYEGNEQRYFMLVHP